MKDNTELINDNQRFNHRFGTVRDKKFTVADGIIQESRNYPVGGEKKPWSDVQPLLVFFREAYTLT